MKLHSVVDVITNSSTTVYVWPEPDAINKAKEFFKEIAAGMGMNMTDGNLELMFDFHFELDPNYLEYDEKLLEEDNEILQEYLEEIGMEYEEFSERMGNWKSEESRKKLENGLTKKVEKLFNEGKFELKEDDPWGESPPMGTMLSLIVTPKNGEPFNLQDKFERIFGVDAIFDG